MSRQRNAYATDADLLAALRLYSLHGDYSSAAKAAGLPRQTLMGRVKQALAKGMDPGQVDETPEWETERISLLDRVREAESKLMSHRRDSITAQAVRKHILKLADAEPVIPSWVIKPGRLGDGAGVPVLKLSDLHWGETVDAGQINGVNRFDLDTAHKRLRRLADKVCSLCFHHMGTSEYPGIVVTMEGDLISGDIHAELSQTNELPTMPTFLDLYGDLIWFFDELAKAFGRVFVSNVPGNHSRMTAKPIYKGRNYSNWDWLMG